MCCFIKLFFHIYFLQENFLPVYVQTGEEKEKNHSVKNSNYLESSIPRSQEKTKNIPSRERRPFIGVNKPEFDAIDKNGAVEQEMTSADNPHYGKTEMTTGYSVIFPNLVFIIMTIEV